MIVTVKEPAPVKFRDVPASEPFITAAGLVCVKLFEPITVDPASAESGPKNYIEVIRAILGYMADLDTLVYRADGEVVLTKR